MSSRPYTCLVTGASGLLGGEMAREMADHYEVTALAHSKTVPGFARVDLREAGSFRDYLDGLRPDIAVHCAAYRDPDFCERQPVEARRLNVEPVRVLCEALPPASRLVLISTDYVFNGDHPPYTEESQRNPVNVYGRSKIEAEDVVRSRRGSVVVRIPVLIGRPPSGGAGGFIERMADAVRSGKATEIENVLIRFPTWTRDVARAVAYLLEKNLSGIYHVSGPRGATQYAWTVEMAGILGARAAHIRPSVTVVPRAARRPLNSQLDTHQILAAGFDGFTDFAEAVRKILGSK